DTTNEKRAKEILTFLRLNIEDRISTLSKGNVAKVNLLLGLSLDVDYILMDEPFSGIDIFTREQIAEVFTSYLVEDKGVLITTHEIHEIEFLVDRVILMDEGIIYGSSTLKKFVKMRDALLSILCVKCICLMRMNRTNVNITIEEDRKEFIMKKFVSLLSVEMDRFLKFVVPTLLITAAVHVVVTVSDALSYNNKL